MSKQIQKILANYSSESPAILGNLYRILTAGELGGTGKLVILPVDQGFEHGPIKSFAPNPVAFDPLYHFELAIEAGLSAYAAPIGMIEAGASHYAGRIPTILKLNSSNSLDSNDFDYDQAFTSSPSDALRLGCSAIGLTIYPGSNNQFDMIEEAREAISEAKSLGLAAVVWSYPRGSGVSKTGTTGIDITCYAAHIAALIGANIIKVKPPTKDIENESSVSAFDSSELDQLSYRISKVKQSCFDGRRLVIFSGGASKDDKSLYEEISAIANGGGNGSIIGRNTFQRPKKEALELLRRIIDIYKNS